MVIITPSLQQSKLRIQRSGTRILAAVFITALLLNSGCVTTAYKKAKVDTPPAVRLEVQFPTNTLAATLNSIITFNGPGSWKRDAFWDEYVVTLRNPGNQSIVVIAGDLFDYSNTVRRARSEPWALEDESKTLEQKYKEDRIAFVRYTAPGVIMVGTGAAVIAGTGYVLTNTAAGIGIGAGATAAAAAAAATVIALPVYYGAVVIINRSNKKAMESAFNQRLLTFPMVLIPGEVRSGSLFFPMVPNPRSLSLRWTAGTSGGECALPLDFLKGLHVQPTPPSAPSK